MEQLKLISFPPIKQQQKYKNDTLEILFLIKDIYIDTRAHLCISHSSKGVDDTESAVS